MKRFALAIYKRYTKNVLDYGLLFLMVTLPYLAIKEFYFLFVASLLLQVWIMYKLSILLNENFYSGVFELFAFMIPVPFLFVGGWEVLSGNWNHFQFTNGFAWKLTFISALVIFPLRFLDNLGVLDGIVNLFSKLKKVFFEVKEIHKESHKKNDE